jgi:hypothetical protein
MKKTLSYAPPVMEDDLLWAEGVLCVSDDTPGDSGESFWNYLDGEPREL